MRLLLLLAPLALLLGACAAGPLTGADEVPTDVAPAVEPEAFGA